MKLQFGCTVFTYFNEQYDFFTIIYPVEMTKIRKKCLVKFVVSYFKTQSNIVNNRQGSLFVWMESFDYDFPANKNIKRK